MNSHFCRHCGARLDLPGAATALAEELYGTPEAEPAPVHVFDDVKVQRILDRSFDLSEKGDNVGAIMACREALEENPDSVSGHSFLALLYERQGEKEKAIRQYEAVLNLNPESTVDRENLHRLKGEMKPLLRTYRGERQPTSHPLGSLLDFLRENEWLQSPYVRAMPIVATVIVSVMFMLLINYAISPSRASDPATAEVSTEAGVKSLMERGRKSFIDGDLEKAEQSFRQALMLSPQDSNAEYWLGRIQQLKTPRETAIAANPASPPPPATPPNPSVPSDQPSTHFSTPQATPPSPSATPPSPDRGHSSAPRSTVRVSNANARNSRTSIPPVPTPFVAERRAQPTTTEKTPAATPQSVPFSPVEDMEKARPAVNAPPKETRLTYRVTSATPVDEDGGAPHSGTSAGGAIEFDGLKYQFKGMQYRHQSRYGEAKQEFQKALTEYRKQKATKTRVRDADEGIRYCEKAIQFCNENLR